MVLIFSTAIIVLVFFVFYIIRWFLKRYIKINKKINLVSVVATLIITPVIYVVLVLAFFNGLANESKKSFDKESWFAEKNRRFEMRDDIVTSGVFIGKNKTEVLEALGQPEENVINNVWKYYLGTSSAVFGVQHNYIILTFNNGKVSHLEKVEIQD